MSDAQGPQGPSDGSEEQPGEPVGSVGSVGEEAAKLFGALADWAKESGPTAGLGAQVASNLGSGLGSGLGDSLTESLSGFADQAAATVSDINAHLATGSAECTYCPVCRTVHAVRQTSPEVKAHLVGAASSFLQAMTGLLATLPPPRSDEQPGGGAGGVERIDLDDDPDDDPDGEEEHR